MGMLLQKAKCSDEVIAAGILHDTLEDTNTTYEELEKQFGTRIAKLVRAASEIDKSLPWQERKQHTIDQLKSAYLEEIQVITADKLHNLKSIQEDLEQYGTDIWKRFNAGKRDQHWYYASIVKSLLPRKKEFKLISELVKTVKNVFGSLDIYAEKEFSALFSCTYDIDSKTEHLLQEYGLMSIAEELRAEAKSIYQEDYDIVISKLEDLQQRGLDLQSNSEGPFLLASFCIAMQKRFNWTDDELYKYLIRNISKL
ncbi:HD domain-containing protein [Bacillus sp. DNRA2]|uniref:HD domain-containing protein n=1 Tax=Bacillus sp. DNRA2 TaxID=2723053 RepID=UPI0032B7A05B